MTVEVTREMILEKLNALGSTADEWAKSLLARGCTGWKSSASHCPLAVYLTSEFPEQSVGVTRTFARVGTLRLWREGLDDTEDVYAPDILDDFVSRVDQNWYSELLVLSGVTIE